MNDIRCSSCNELNDKNAIKCESCKAILGTSTPHCSEEDECEKDFRFIEEAEFIGEVYKLENLNEELEIAHANTNNYGHLENITFEIVELPKKPTVDSGNVEESEVDELIVDDDSTKEIPISNIKTNLNKVDITGKSTKKKLKTNQPKECSVTTPAVSYPYQCTQCPKSFKRKATLMAHINRIHHPESTCVCCARNVPIKTINETQSSACASPVLSCEPDFVCSDKEEGKKPTPNQLISPQKRKRILKNKSNSEKEQTLPRLRQKIKRRIFKNESNSKTNFTTRNFRRKCRVRILSLDSKQNKAKGIVYKCTACEKINYSYHEHLKHIVIHEDVGDTLTIQTSLNQLKKKPSGFLKCEDCKLKFMSTWEYRIHQRSHEGIHKCDICNTILLTERNLRKHKRRMHKHRFTRNSQMFECNICNEKFKSQVLMLQHRKSHIEVMNEIEKMTIIDRSNGKTTYICKICTKTSSNKFRHEEHLRVHTKEKPYKCKKCGINISTSNAMAHHMRAHDNITFDCKICKAKYRHKKSLKKHLVKHTGEKPFKCRYCDKKFAFNYTRAMHERYTHVDGILHREKNEIE